MALPKPSRSQFVVSVAAVIALAVVVALVWGFGQQLVLARQIRTEEIWLEQEVETEQARNDDLVAQLEYVKSGEYVEHWARAEAKMVKPGEVVAVPLSDTGGEPVVDPQPELSPEPEARPFWVEWWELAFGP